MCAQNNMCQQKKREDAGFFTISSRNQAIASKSSKLSSKIYTSSPPNEKMSSSTTPRVKTGTSIFHFLPFFLIRQFWNRASAEASLIGGGWVILFFIVTAGSALFVVTHDMKRISDFAGINFVYLGTLLTIFSTQPLPKDAAYGTQERFKKIFHVGLGLIIFGTVMQNMSYVLDGARSEASKNATIKLDKKIADLERGRDMLIEEREKTLEEIQALKSIQSTQAEVLKSLHAQVTTGLLEKPRSGR
jgi:hypothetical protein